jgi:hypothetical protein
VAARRYVLDTNVFIRRDFKRIAWVTSFEFTAPWPSTASL